MGGRHDPVSIGLVIFGSQQRALRELAGLTQAELGKRIICSESLVRMVERGERRPKPAYLKAADRALEARGLLLVAAKHLDDERYPTWFVPYRQTEAEAVAFNAYDSNVVNGLLQTEEYARAVLMAACPSFGDAELEQRLAARMDRQSLLARAEPPMMAFAMEEWVLRRPIGGPAVLKRQLHRLLEVGEARHVTLQVMPMDSETHAGLDGPLHLITLPDGRRLGYVEGQAGSSYVTDPGELSALEQRFGNIRAQALNAEASLCLIDRLAGEL
ncbi:helix-turn-helix transcriptional regulator [Streptomyces sp. PTM05]|uniref:Helix-turn-helix transcriptional regulator n=1 Tax=Streptantibioticus parmotrematis TaxID=2873249 RepID=A0ABS7QX46_9ACTN|nr:helix-turn-helix transcriptional regulator [Streptantibioticus parmotrematis]MBY8887772.1 helix-turn-helix transcriptional regulator [Streptantibioticus parmotrematis]